MRGARRAPTGAREPESTAATPRSEPGSSSQATLSAHEAGDEDDVSLAELDAREESDAFDASDALDHSNALEASDDLDALAQPEALAPSDVEPAATAPAPRARLSREWRAIEARDATVGRAHDTPDAPATSARRGRERRAADSRAGARAASRSSRGRHAVPSAARGRAGDARPAAHEPRGAADKAQRAQRARDSARALFATDERSSEHARALVLPHEHPISSTHELFAVDDLPALGDAALETELELEGSAQDEPRASTSHDVAYADGDCATHRGVAWQPSDAVGSDDDHAGPLASEGTEDAADAADVDAAAASHDREAALEDGNKPRAEPALEAHGALAATEKMDAAAAMDAEVGAALARGDTRRGVALCAELHGASIGRFCMALLGSRAEADATTLDVLLEAYRHADELGRERPIRGWLLGLARRACARQLERRPKRRDAATEAAADDEPAELTRARRARALLERVHPSEREALVLRFAADASTTDMALACNLEPAEAQRHLSHALGHLREVMENEASDE